MLFYKNIQKYLINIAPQSINMRKKANQEVPLGLSGQPLIDNIQEIN